MGAAFAIRGSVKEAGDEIVNESVSAACDGYRDGDCKRLGKGDGSGTWEESWCGSLGLCWAAQSGGIPIGGKDDFV